MYLKNGFANDGGWVKFYLIDSPCPLFKKIYQATGSLLLRPSPGIIEPGE